MLNINFYEDRAKAAKESKNYQLAVFLEGLITTWMQLKEDDIWSQIAALDGDSCSVAYLKNVTGRSGSFISKRVSRLLDYGFISSDRIESVVVYKKNLDTCLAVAELLSNVKYFASEEELLLIGKALENVDRYIIWSSLVSKEMSVWMTSIAFGCSQPKISKMLKQLHSADLIDVRNEGPTRYYLGQNKAVLWETLEKLFPDRLLF